MPYGYNGRILHVDLSISLWEVEEPTETWYRTYIGGSSLASYYLLKNLKPGVDPLSDESVLVFACSVLTGAPISYSTATPLPPNLPSKEDLGRVKPGDKRIRVASIGPAGERLIPFSCVQNELEHFNGRTGMGAVMGSKNLKAIAVRGSKKIQLANPDKVKEIARCHNARIKTHKPNVALTKYGTPGLVRGLNDTGMLPTRNFQDGVFEGYEKIAAEAYHDTIYHSSGTCYACSVKCKRRVALEDDTYPLDPRFGGPEYEALAALGSMLGNDNLPAIARGAQICNLMGLDVISSGAVIAFAMECFEEGVLTEADTGGRSLHFGDADSMLWLIEEIAHRRGLGEILSGGVKKASELIGRESEKCAFHIKGQEMAFHDGRGKTGMALGFALSPTGADHIETPHDTAFAATITNLLPLGILDPVNPLTTDASKVRYFSLGQKAWGLNNCYGICNFCSVPIHAMTFSRLVEAVRAITGWDTSVFEILKVAERSNVMARVFNNREGFGPEDDRVISRWHEEMPKGPLKGQYIDPKELQDAIELYYELSGWDKQGRPTRGKLVDLNLEWLIE